MVKVALISPNYGRRRAYRELQFSPNKRISEEAPFRAVLPRKSENNLMNRTTDRICPDNLLGQRHESDQGNTQMYAQHFKIYFKENYFLYVLDQRSNSGTGSKLIRNLKQSQLAISLYDM